MNYSEGDEQARDWERQLPACEPKIEEERAIDETFERMVNVLQNNLVQVNPFAFSEDVQVYLKSRAYGYDRINIINRNDTPVFIICEISKSNIGWDGYSIWTGDPEKAGLTPVEGNEDEGYF
jgi:hypothetical protein